MLTVCQLVIMGAGTCTRGPLVFASEVLTASQSLRLTWHSSASPRALSSHSSKGVMKGVSSPLFCVDLHHPQGADHSPERRGACSSKANRTRAVVEGTPSPSTREAESDRSLKVQG